MVFDHLKFTTVPPPPPMDAPADLDGWVITTSDHVAISNMQVVTSGTCVNIQPSKFSELEFWAMILLQ